MLIQPMPVGKMAGVAMIEYVGDLPGDPPSFRWAQRCSNDAVVVCLAGELDLATVELAPLLMRVAESGRAATIVLDMSEVSFIDAHSIGVIVRAWAAARTRGRVLQVDGLRGLPARVFRLLELEPLLVRRTCSDRSGGNAGDQ